MEITSTKLDPEFTGKIARFLRSTEEVLEWLLFFASLFATLFWLSGKGLFYSDDAPVLSPFTSISLFIMIGCRVAQRKLVGWSKPMTLAFLIVVACGNLSSILMLTLVPELLFASAPKIVATSILTSFGIISFCIYEIVVTVRKSPNSGLLIDDIFLHFALFPGALSLLGLLMNIPSYRGIAVDPRVGISTLEMCFMGTFALYAVASNPNLFLWRFLTKRLANRIAFAILFLNQYLAPILVGLAFGTNGKPGVELFVILAGFLATLSFLVMHAMRAN